LAAGGTGEVRAGTRLAKHLEGYDVKLLHDRRISRRGNANIDHIAIGPGGVTVIDTKTHRGNIHVDRVGGLFSARRSVLMIGGRDQTSLIDGVERQIDLVRTRSDTSERIRSTSAAHSVFATSTVFQSSPS